MTHVSHTATTVATTRFVPHATLAMGTLGALVGGTMAAAKNIRSVKEGDMAREEAVRGVVREAAGTGLATAAATAVVGTLGITGFAAGVGIVALATGTKYLWDAGTNKMAASEPEAAPATVEKKATATKTSTKKTKVKK